MFKYNMIFISISVIVGTMAKEHIFAVKRKLDENTNNISLYIPNYDPNEIHRDNIRILQAVQVVMHVIPAALTIKTKTDPGNQAADRDDDDNDDNTRRYSRSVTNTKQNRFVRNTFDNSIDESPVTLDNIQSKLVLTRSDDPPVNVPFAKFVSKHGFTGGAPGKVAAITIAHTSGKKINLPLHLNVINAHLLETFKPMFIRCPVFFDLIPEAALEDRLSDPNEWIVKVAVPGENTDNSLFLPMQHIIIHSRIGTLTISA